MLAISFGARWIVKPETSQRLFGGRLLNVHCARLPMDRGGGGLSWRIMRGDRLGNLALHVIDGGIDTGGLVAFEDYVIPRSCRTPAEIAADSDLRLMPFLAAVLNRAVGKRHVFPLLSQPSYLASYWPRLHTPTHGWIDWSWPPADIERFILAFGDPYPGAFTMWHDGVVLLRDAQLHVGEPGHHPFQAGLIVRKRPGYLLIALRDGFCLIVETATDESGTDLMPQLAEGDRLFTPPEKLAEAQAARVSFGPEGLRG